jgi:nicotinamide-nucleotide amidase
MLIERRRTIAIAESCTGGLLGHLLTEVAGISACLERDVIAYSNQAKVENLGVDEALIREHGAVSPEVAQAMAIGVRRQARTDIGVSTTGIAGPTGGSEAKPVGLVYAALAHDRGCTLSEKIFRGTRDVVKQRAAFHVLDMLRCYLLDIGG